MKVHHEGCTFCGTSMAWSKDAHQAYRVEWTNDGSNAVPGAQLSEKRRQIDVYMHVCVDCLERIIATIDFMERMNLGRIDVPATPRKPAGSMG